MRLIDADAAKKKIIKEIVVHLPKFNAAGFAIVTAVAKMFDSEDDFPTVDAKPVRCGKWIEQDDGSYYTCSFCKNEWITLEGNPIDNNMKYCPQCGAKMI